jgi:glycosyltransferase involved in cell wall biosynthesis
MKILHVDKFLRRQGGAAGYMLDVAGLQRSVGHTVEHFSTADPSNHPSSLERHFPPTIDFEPVPEGVVAKGQAMRTMLWSTRARSGMAAALEDFRPDIVHLHTFYHQLSPSILRPIAARGIPVVMSVHDYKLLCPSYRMLSQGLPCEACFNKSVVHAVRRRCKDDSLVSSTALAIESGLHRALGAYQAVDVFICPSRFMFEKVSASHLYGERARYLPHFVDTFPPRGGQRRGCVYTGRLAAEKGIDTLIRAVGAVGDLPLRVAGEGPLRAELEHLAAEVAPGLVTFLGQLPRPELLEELGNALFAVAPSRWYENQPIAVLEAMACGTAPVVTRIGGLPELVEDGVSGLIVPVDDVAALTAALRQSSDAGVVAAIGGKAREAARARYSAEAHLRGLDKLYAEAGRRRAPRQETEPAQRR